LLRKLPIKHELDTLVRAQLLQPELAGMKPAQISKLLKVDVREVYAAKQKALHQAKKSRVPRPDGRAAGD
jgi:DNA-directed RNA polymerase specialized sigma24 family protein